MPTFGDVQLLLHGGQAAGSTTIVDSSIFNRDPSAVNNVTYENDANSFAGTDLRFSGASEIEYLGVGDGGPFTVEWFGQDDTNGAGSVHDYVANFGVGDSGLAAGAWRTGLTNDVLSLTYENLTRIQGSLPVGAAQRWYASVVYDGAKLWLFIDDGAGTAVSQGSWAATGALPTKFVVGRNSAGLNGNMEEVRFTKGVWYPNGTSYPVPTAPFPDASTPLFTKEIHIKKEDDLWYPIRSKWGYDGDDVKNLNAGRVGMDYLSGAGAAGVEVDADGFLQRGSSSSAMVGEIRMFTGDPLDLAVGWHVADGTSGTIDLTDRFVIGVGANSLGATGGGDQTSSDGGFPAQATYNNTGHKHTVPHAGFGATSGNDILFYAMVEDPQETTLELSHEHAVTGEPDHSHTATPPFYALYFIQYTGVA